MYLLWSGRTQVSHTVAGSHAALHPSLGPHNDAEEESWYQDNLALWSEAGFVGIADEAALRSAIDEAVARRYPGDPFEPQLLSRDLCSFFRALAAPNPSAYLENLKDSRRLKAIQEVLNDEYVHWRYRELTKRQLPSDVDPRTAFELLWRGQSDEAGRPRDLGRKSFLQVCYSKPLPEKVEPRSSLASITHPLSLMAQVPDSARWLGPFCMGFVRMTEPLANYGDLLKEQKRVLVCDSFFVLRTYDDQVFPVNFLFFFSPQTQRWYLEMAGAYYPYRLFWPI